VKKKKLIRPLLCWGGAFFCFVFFSAFIAMRLARRGPQKGGRDSNSSRSAQASARKAPPHSRGIGISPERPAQASAREAPGAKAPRCSGGVRIPSGVYLLGSSRGQIDERPVRKVKLKAFVLDRCEVSWDRYMKCVAAGRCESPPGEKPKKGQLPVTRVSFRDATTFCRWEGKAIPSEDQWEAAARGRDGRRYPWGEEASCHRANYGAFDQQGPCAGVNPGRPREVGSGNEGKSPFGVLDMAGNVWEWTRCSGSSRCIKGEAVLKGGSCCSMFLLPRSANRWPLTGSYRDGDIGFRCLEQVETNETPQERR
jgi:formylglycine-generating enzyme required for sulfatase activity